MKLASPETDVASSVTPVCRKRETDCHRLLQIPIVLRLRLCPCVSKGTLSKFLTFAQAAPKGAHSAREYGQQSVY